MENRLSKSSLGTIFLLLIFLSQFNWTLAQNELSDAQVMERLQYIEQKLEEGKSNANAWWYGWLIGYSAATIGQGVVYFTSDVKTTRQDMALGAATTFLGATGQIINPMVPGYAPDRLANIPDATPEERKAKLLKAEELLKKCALREKEGISWETHAITGAVNLSSGLITWLGFKRNFLDGVLNFLLNTIVTEVQIFTQPTKAISDYDNYHKKFNYGQELSCHESEKNWFVSVYPGGLEIIVVF